MSSTNYGYIRIGRQTFVPGTEGDPFWQEDRVFSKWEAWVYCYQIAQWQSRTLHTSFGSIPLERGEFVASTRHLAAQFKWCQKRVRTWLAGCLGRGTLKAQRETQAGMVYLIVEYETYQDTTVAEGTPKGTVEGTAGAQPSPKKGTRTRSKEVKKKKTSNTSGDVKCVYSPEFELLWHAYPKRHGENNKRTAYRQFEARLNQGVAFDQMHDGVLRYAAYAIAKGIVGTEMVKMASTFLGRDQHFLQPYDIPTQSSTSAPAPAYVDRANTLYQLYMQHGFSRVQSPEAYKEQIAELARTGVVREPRRFWAELQAVRPWTWLPSVRHDQSRTAVTRIATAISSVPMVVEKSA